MKKLHHLRFLSFMEHYFDLIAISGFRFVCERLISEVKEFGIYCLQVIMQPVKQGQQAI